MKRTRLIVGAACAAACVAALGAAGGLGGAGQPAAGQPAEKKAGAYVLGYTMNMIDGTPQDLSAYKGKVVMIVNVASKCGLTPQYEALEKLYKERKDQGFVILGFPANNFGSQEPGSNSEIKEFCTEKYGVTFPMFEKISVKGDDTHPLYQQLTALPPPLGGEPKWNFTKFIVDRKGNVVARFEPKTKPEDKAVTDRIDSLLKEKQ